MIFARNESRLDWEVEISKRQVPLGGGVADRPKTSSCRPRLPCLRRLHQGVFLCAALLAIPRRLPTGRGRNAVRYPDSPAQADLSKGTATNRALTYDAARPRKGSLEDELLWKLTPVRRIGLGRVFCLNNGGKA
jgi:hypothetical protein